MNLFALIAAYLLSCGVIYYTLHKMKFRFAEKAFLVVVALLSVWVPYLLSSRLFTDVIIKSWFSDPYSVKDFCYYMNDGVNSTLPIFCGITVFMTVFAVLCIIAMAILAVWVAIHVVRYIRLAFLSKYKRGNGRHKYAIREVLDYIASKQKIYLRYCRFLN